MRPCRTALLWLVLCAGCSRPEPELVEGCFAASELTAGDFARQSGADALFLWPIGHNAGDDLLEALGFQGHLLALPGSPPRAPLDASARLDLTGRVVKVSPSWVERHLGRRRAHALAEARVDGTRYVVHATTDAHGWNASLPSRCRAQTD
jgi:hypothetical protein